MVRSVPAALVAALATLATATPALAVDTVFGPNLIEQGSGCFGLDCVNGELFGQDTLRLKENILRINFDDTTTTAGTPANDWTLAANDALAGGDNKFMLQDITGTRTPFSVFAGTPTDSLVVRNGRVGIGNPDPALQLHLTKTDTPAIRMEQTNAGGFTPQTWDIGANEANWFVRDQTGGSRLPLRIRPGAPTNSLDIGANGNVGMGVASTGPVDPIQPLQVKRVDGTARIEVQEANPTAAARILTDLVNNGPAQLRFTNTAAGGEEWLAGAKDASDFVVAPDGSSFAPLTVAPSGDVGAAGAVTQGADPAAAENATPVDGGATLQALRALPLSTREYTADAANTRHLWPTAADFSAAFGLGANDGKVAPGDMAGVALAAVKGLDARVSALSLTPGPQGGSGPSGPAGATGAVPPSVGKRIKALEKRNKSLTKSLSSLQKTVRKLARRK